MATMHENGSVAEVLEHLRGYESNRHVLRGHHHLQHALTLAVDLLDDQSRSASHDIIRRLVQSWFERVRNWWPSKDQSPETVRLYQANVELFNVPQFGISEKHFDANGLAELFALMKRPYDSWTRAERTMYKERWEQIEKSWAAARSEHT